MGFRVGLKVAAQGLDGDQGGAGHDHPPAEPNPDENLPCREQRGLQAHRVAVGQQQASAFEWLLVSGLLGLTLALSGPALLLHLRYWLLNHETTLVFQPTENRFEVYEAGQRVAFAQRDLARVERVTCRARRTFRARYDYLRLHLADGRVVVLTSLLTDLEPLMVFLRSVPIERRAVAWCWA